MISRKKWFAAGGSLGLGALVVAGIMLSQGQMVPPFVGGGGGGTMTSAQVNALYDPSYIVHRMNSWCDELDGNDSSTTACIGAHVASNTSGGATANGGTSLRPSVCQLSTSTSATGESRVGVVRTTYSFHATDHTVMEAIGVSIPILDDGTEKFDAYIGFVNNINAVEPTDGAYFLYHATSGGGAGGTNSANWQIGTAASSVRLRATLDGSTTDTLLRPVAVGNAGVVPETGEVDNFKIDCTTARCDFYMQRMGTDSDYVRVGSACAGGTCSMLATSIPVAVATAGTHAFGVGASIVKWALTTARTMTLDVVCSARNFSAAR